MLSPHVSAKTPGRLTASCRPFAPDTVPSCRLDAVRVWLTRTFAGRLLIAGVALKLVHGSGSSRSGGPDCSARSIVGGLRFSRRAGDRLRVYALARHRLLWRVRRKLILSYVFIGVVPVLLVVSFSCSAALLLFFNVSAYMLRNHVATRRGRRAVPGAGGCARRSRRLSVEVTSGLVTRQHAAARGIRSSPTPSCHRQSLQQRRRELACGTTRAGPWRPR